MIRVSLGFPVFLWIGGSLLLIFAAWLFSEWRRQRRERAAFRHIVRCAICACAYRDESDEDLSTCPRCARLNERGTWTRL